MDIFSEAFALNNDSIKYCTESNQAILAAALWMQAQPVWAELAPNIARINMSGRGDLTIQLTDEAKKGKAALSFVRLFGKMEKRENWDHASIDLVKDFEQDTSGYPYRSLHPSGLTSVRINYMPESCRVVEERKPISPELAKQYEDFITNGVIQRRVDCGPEEVDPLAAGVV